ncbi:MAG: ribbon-helix-helix domain-containing protein [Candidatus Fibromonas sp.]|jgi:predicted CopG family antitoxin|nr:ribbon-helix-helix domain-containing protein [Candidatus Fibromonas sp.]
MTTLSINEDLFEQINAEAQSEARSATEVISDAINSYIRKKQKNKTIAIPSNSFMDFYGIFKDKPIPDKVELRKEFHEKSSH